MKNQLKAGVILSYLSTGISIVIQLIYMPIMIRLLGQSEYGLYSLVSGVVSYLSLFSLGFSGAYLRFFSRFNQRKDKKGLASLNGMFITLFCVLAMAALVCGIILSFFPKQIFGSKLSSSELVEAKILMIILVINMAVTLISSIFDSITSAYEQFIFQRIVGLLSVIINPFVCLPLLLMGYRSIMLVTVAFVISVTKLIVNIWFCFGKLKIPVSFHNFEFGLLREISTFSFFLLLNMVIDQINWNVDKLILSHTNGTREIAVYGVASQINSLFITFSTTISSVFSPRINRIAVEEENYQKKFTDLMIKVGRIQWLLLGLATAGFIVFGKYFIVHIYAGKGYEKAYTASLYLVLPVLIPLIQNVGIEMQRALNKHQFRSLIYFIMAVINVFISIPLAGRFGCVGAAMGTAVSLLVANGLIMNVFYHKVLGINMKLFWKEIAKTLKGFVIPIIAGIWIMRMIEFNSIIKYIIWGIIYVLLYCTSIFFISCNKEEKQIILSLVNRKKYEK